LLDVFEDESKRSCCHKIEKTGGLAIPGNLLRSFAGPGNTKEEGNSRGKFAASSNSSRLPLTTLLLYDLRNCMDKSPRGSPEGKKQVTIRDLFPGLSDDQVKEAEANLHRYFKFALRTIDTSEPEVTIKERSIVSLKNNLFEHG